jgi:hypothetical protein
MALVLILKQISCKLYMIKICCQCANTALLHWVPWVPLLPTPPKKILHYQTGCGHTGKGRFTFSSYSTVSKRFFYWLNPPLEHYPILFVNINKKLMQSFKKGNDLQFKFWYSNFIKEGFSFFQWDKTKPPPPPPSPLLIAIYILTIEEQTFHLANTTKQRKE